MTERGAIGHTFSERAFRELIQKLQEECYDDLIYDEACKLNYDGPLSLFDVLGFAETPAPKITIHTIEDLI